MIADTIIEELRKELSIYKESPYAETYLAVLKQITDWNQQIAEHRIDLYGTKELKEFDRVTKYFSEIKSLTDTLDYLRSKMKPEEVDTANKKARTPYEQALQQTGQMK